MPTTTNVKQVKVNVMTEEQYTSATKNPNEFYAVTDAALSYNDLVDKPTIGDATLTIQKNGTAIDTFTANATVNKTINVTVPTQASDVGAVASNTAITGATKCKITYDSKGLVTAGADLSAGDIPNLTLSKITDITATATELNYVDGVTSAIQTQLNGKQATISDLDTIRSGASAGATAVQPSAIANMQTTTNIVQSVRASSSAETTKYPSEKAVALSMDDLTSQIDQEKYNRIDMDNALSDRIDDAYDRIDDVEDDLIEFSVKTTDTIPITNYNLLNVPVQYKGETTQNYTNGYFYTFTNPVYSSTVTVQTGSFTVVVNNATFISKILKTGRHRFVRTVDDYETDCWYNNIVGYIYNLSPYGITITGTVNTGNVFYIDFTMDTTVTRIDVQPANAGTVTSVNNIQPVNGNVTLSIPSDTSDLTNGAGFITSSALNGYATETWVGQQGFLTSITSSDVTTALGYTPPTINSTNNYVPYRSSATAFSNSTLMYDSNAMAFTGRLHIGSSSPASYYSKGRLTIYDNTPSQQVSSIALLNYGGGGGCGVAIDMYNTNANEGIPSGRFGLIDNGNYSGFLQLQVKKSGAGSNPLLPAMNVVPLPASSSTTTCVSFGKDEYGNALFDLHKSEEYLSISNSDQRWSGSGTTYHQTTNNVFGYRLIISAGDIVYFTAGTEATVTSVTSTSTSIQITTDRTLGNINNQRLYVKKAYFKVTDENYNTKIIINPYGKMGLGTSAPAYDLDVNGTINASTDVKINGQSVALASSVPTDTSDLTNGAGYITGITSSDVTSALGYTPYNSSNPAGYTSNVGTVTSVNNVNPVNGNVTISIPSEVTETTVSGWGFTKNAGTVTSVNNVSPVNGNVTLSIPTVDQSYDGTSTNAQSGVAVKSAIDSAISSVYKPAGSVAFASLPALSSQIEGYVYNVTDSFTTTSDFVEGSGKTYPAGTNVVCIDVGSSVYKWDVLSGIVDLSGYVPTSRTINNKALTSNISLTASDVGALPDSTVIPTVNNATLTIQKNGTQVATFTANSSSNVTANISVPTDTNDLTNGAGYITSSALSGYLQNTATGTGSLTILGTANTNSYSVNIGTSSSAGQFGTAVGYGSETISNGVAVGQYAKSNANLAIQIGRGTNTEANSCYIGLSAALNYKLIGSDGKIPDGRLPIASSVSSSSTNAEVVGAKLFYDTCGDIETLINAL